MKIEDVTPGSQIIYCSVKCWYVGRVTDQDDYPLAGFKPGEANGIGWPKDQGSETAKSLLDRYGCDHGYWVSTEVELVVGSIKSSTAHVGLTCKICRDYAAHAEPNRPDGSFICYSCRSGWIPTGM